MLADFESLRRLPVAEKLQLIDWLWQDIDESADASAIADAVLAEAERRAEQLAGDPSATISQAELWRQVDARRG